MIKDEDIASYMLWVDEVVTGIRGIGGEVKEYEIVNKFLRSLTKAYIHKVSNIKESKDLDKYSIDEMFGTLTTFEMREFDKDVPKKEATFKVSKNIKYDPKNQNYDFDEIESKFVR